MGFFDVELTYENKILVELYNDIVDPTNYSLDWQSYMMFCYLDDLPNWKQNRKIITHIRRVVNDYREAKNSPKKNVSNTIGQKEDKEEIKRI